MSDSATTATDSGEETDVTAHAHENAANDDGLTLSPSDSLDAMLRDVLQRPAAEGARILALRWLTRLEHTRERWHDAVSPPPQRESSAEYSVRAASSEDATSALHKVRVNLRRLRATLGEYSALLSEGPNKRDLKHLSALNRATSAARDADVQCEWLDAEAGTLPDDARQEAALLRVLLGNETASHVKRVKRAFEKHFDGRAEALHRDLTHYMLLGTVGVPLDVQPFAHQVAARLDRAASHVIRTVSAAHSVHDEDELHRARKSLKRLRALLVPFVAQLPMVGELYDNATRGQDTLGAMRDAQLLAERARSEHLPALAAALDNVQLGHFNAFASEWMDDAGTRALSAVNAVRRALHASATHTDAPSDTSALPKEIERKYLLSGCPPEAAAVPGTRIEQGWIPGRVLRERLRRSTYPTGVSRYTRTVKAGGGLERIELEEDTERALFDVLWPLTTERRVRKRRHAIREGKYTWEIDVFTDRDLVLAEVEMKSVEEHPTLPPWLAPWVVREVTGERQFFNAYMARSDFDSASTSSPTAVDGAQSSNTGGKVSPPAPTVK
jgi:adenylate cyclase